MYIFHSMYGTNYFLTIDKTKVLESNIRNIHLNTPDYKGMDPATALKDFQKRRENYFDVYQPVDNIDGPHIKIINNETFVVYNVRGYLPQKVRINALYWQRILFPAY